MAEPELTPAEAKAVRWLEKEPQTKAALAKSGLEASGLAKLMAAGWIIENPPAKGARACKFALTDTGRHAIERLPTPKPARVTRASSENAIADAETLGQIIRDEFTKVRVELRAEIAELRKLLITPGAAAKSNGEASRPSGAPFDPIVFRKALRATISEIDRRDHHDGLVPIGKVRRTLAYMGLDGQMFNTALLDEERAYTVDLKIANDPNRVKEPEGGIFIEGRGLLYFVVLR